MAACQAFMRVLTWTLNVWSLKFLEALVPSSQTDLFPTVCHDLLGLNCLWSGVYIKLSWWKFKMIEGQQKLEASPWSTGFECQACLTWSEVQPFRILD